MPRPSLPLPPNFFRCPRLSEEEVQNYTSLAIATATQVVKQSQLRSGGIAWVLRADEGNWRFYKAPDPLARPGTHMFMSVTEVAGTLDEVIEIFDTSTTLKAKEYAQRFGKGLLDAVNLYSLLQPTAEQPNEKIAISWWALEGATMEQIIKPRDAVVLECTHEFTWFTGGRAWVRAFRSVDLACVPDLNDTLGLVRTIQYGVGHVCVESPDRPGYIQVSFFNHFDVKGTTPDWFIEKNYKRRLRSILELELFLRENRLSNGYLLSPAEFVPLNRRRHCFLCRKKFNPWSHRSNCWKCGEVLCKACNSSWKIRSNGQLTPIKACLRCAQGVPPPESTTSSLERRGDGSSHSGSGHSSGHHNHQPMRPTIFASPMSPAVPRHPGHIAERPTHNSLGRVDESPFLVAATASLDRGRPSHRRASSFLANNVGATTHQPPPTTTLHPRSSSMDDTSIAWLQSHLTQSCKVAGGEDVDDDDESDAAWTTTWSPSDNNMATTDNSSSASEDFIALTSQWTTDPKQFREMQAAVRRESPQGPILLEF
ncbi:Aste57867_2510 [Aphanomyces stellatus]|uniref:Aste57867_2510 protein n=1 Tax=Aphanomyces stellatus TaxID=120398 RepID=A0A485K8G3_9STRA|nr:hypothetical protein As57867_002503 [Aphanomyces stellatus]VFT79709.1 Aste57867_2510 [Aphanomyces stellatus]